MNDKQPDGDSDHDAPFADWTNTHGDIIGGVMAIVFIAVLIIRIII